MDPRVRSVSHGDSGASDYARIRLTESQCGSGQAGNTPSGKPSVEWECLVAGREESVTIS